MTKRKQLRCAADFYYVAGEGVEPPSQGYEPRNVPFVHPAVK